MINGIKTLSGGIVSNDSEDLYGSLVVLENANMNVSYTSKIAIRTLDIRGKEMWIVKELGYNVDDETIYIKTASPVTEKPAFVPDILL